ncbi:MAG: GDSL-type esterase/lipase family protein [Candidatus Bathyarchaeota archaeon]|nr:GDSL-type esterase/lipase family protein [Candidatus Bathyarchaeota archaeon]
MNKQEIVSLAIRLFVLFIVITITASFILARVNKESPQNPILVACVGDSITQSSVYPYELSLQLGEEGYTVRNFGVGSTTVCLDSETPYMDTNAFQEALDFQPDIVIIMLGTNDAQPSLHSYNASFVNDYTQIVAAFQNLSSEPKIWIVLPPPIFSNQGGAISPEYFANTIIPSIEQVATQNNLPLIDVYSALADYSDYFYDGVHPTMEGGKLIGDEIYKALKPTL